MMIRFMIIASAVASLMGCESLGFDEYAKRNHESEKILARIEAQRLINTRTDKVVRIEQPPVLLTPIKAKIDMAYLSVPVSVNASGLSLSTVMEDLLQNVNVMPWYGSGVRLDEPVSLNYQGSLLGALNAIESQLSIGFTPSEDSLKIERFVSRTFELELPPGMISDQIGASESSTSGGEEEGTIQIEGQYVKLSSTNVDVFSEVAEGIKSLLAFDPNPDEKADDVEDRLMGSVRSIPSLSRLVVRTTPARMKEVDVLVTKAKDALKRQVVLEIQVLEFRSNLGHERGIDWNLVRDIGSESSLNFFIPGTSLLFKGASPGLAFTGGGKWDGTTALINALNKQGQVSTETPISILVQNHQTNHITQGNTIEFLENVGSNSDEGVVATQTERGVRREGVDFIVVPNIQRDHVYLRTSGMLTKIESLPTQEVAGEILTFPKIRDSKINFANKLKYGQTIVIASVSQMDSTTDANSFLGIPFLGGNSAIKQRVETLVLLTPRRADG
ncbi:hypothetical protein MACH09_45320 [Vibrio sp. MACH09]|uniref:type II secretion system protein GspD n=1 Tax=Vibrio sp. MACH09 TaxID=3025122 RepID=UPI00278F65A6|nr:hypothetical protein [Vibrio sp. MACH09]GLO64024.1 hypothetical protein MACH09_45320 [Vibrio sp. MACH09]